MGSFRAISTLLVAVSLPLSVWSHSNGMDMSMDGSMSLAQGTMLPYLHFTTGDILWFEGWVPQKAGAMVGACVGLFLLALFERWLAACRAMMELHWANQVRIALAKKVDPSQCQPASTSTVIATRSAPPFIPAHDFARGVLHAGQMALTFAFMLAVMTFQVGFILSIVVGLGVGETLFGRYIHHVHLH